MSKNQETKRYCFARRHQKPGDFAYYYYALAVSRASGVFYSDDRRVAKEFGEKGICKNAIGRARRRLEKHGWFIRIGKGRRQRRNPLTGSWEPLRYQVLTHEEWIVKHPGKCRFPKLVSESDTDQTPVPKKETGKLLPVPNLEFTSPQNEAAPVPKMGTKNVKKACKERKDTHRKEKPTPKTGVSLSDEETKPGSYGKPNCPSPVPVSGTGDDVRPEDVQAVIDKISDMTQGEV